MLTITNIVTAPTTYPVTIAEVKAHLRIDSNDEDDKLNSLIFAATSYFDYSNGVLGIAIMPQTWDIAITEIPVNDRIWLPIAPVNSITSFKYFDQNGAEQTLSSSNYRLVGNKDRSYIELKSIGVWPSTLEDRDYPITIRCECGYSACPEGLKHAIFLTIGHWYENRENASTLEYFELPMSVAALIAPYKKRNY